MSSQGSNAVLVESSYEYKRPILPPKHRYMSNYLNIPHVDAESSTANGNIGVFENGLVESPILSNGDITNAGGIILPVNPPEDDIFIDSQTDPFLLVSLRQKPPPRPKFEFLLYLFGILDIAIVFICSYFSIYNAETGWHWNRAEWDMIILALFRFIVVLKVSSSTWISKSRYLLGGACCISSLYIIFKANLMFQHKRPTQGYDLILIASSFFFLQLHWIANVIITTDTKYRDLFLRANTIVFEEESNDFSDGLPEEHDNISRNDTPSSLPYYGATDNYNSTSVDKGARI